MARPQVSNVSGMSFTFTASCDTLELNAGGNVVPLLYESVKRGHPRFYVAMVDGEIEFVPAPCECYDDSALAPA
jgi:hypothetical protein